MDDSVRIDALPEPLPAAEEQLRVSVEQRRPDVVLVRMSGDLDLYTATVFRDGLRPQLENGAAAVVLDLTLLGFIGSAGLAELVSAQDLARDAGVRLSLVATGRNVLRPLEVTGLRAAFRVFDSVEDALREV